MKAFFSMSRAATAWLVFITTGVVYIPIAGAKHFENGPAVIDSIGIEVLNGKEMIIHRLEPKETYYGLSRRYGVPVQELVNANNNKPLQIGETIRIPTDRPAQSISKAVPTAAEVVPSEVLEERTTLEPIKMDPDEYTLYIVGKGETLYAVSKRFRVPIESIKRANGLTGDQLQTGVRLRVPKNPLPEPVEALIVEEAIDPLAIIDTTSTARMASADFELQKDRYGIREMNERGVGVWIDDFSQDGANMLALHKTAPVGTVIKVTNPMTNHSTFVKVVGKFVDTAETREAIIVISRSVASVIGIFDRRFQVEIAYGMPSLTNAQ